MRSPPARDGADGRPLLWPRRRIAATNGSATELRIATRVARPLPQPVFRPGGGHKPAAGRALSRLARVFFARHP